MITTLLEKQRAFFSSGQTETLSFRLKQLQNLADWIKKNEEDILAALHKDLGKAAFEGYATEIAIVLDEIKYARKHLAKWVKDRRLSSPIKQFPSKCFCRPGPYGKVLIMSAWNYPFQLSIVPLVGAIAAGNTAVIKPSELSAASSRLISRMIGECYSEEYVAVYEGGVKESQELLGHKFDYIFFTGSVAVGKMIMAAAANFLTPLTLELGGKSPCIVDETADVLLSARRISWGKFLNAGQTCVAPDYLLVHHTVKDALVKAIKECITKFYGAEPLKSPDYPKIINRKHFERIQSLFSKGEIIAGGKIDEDSLKIEPTILAVDLGSPAMAEEIFGPLLPIISYKNLEEARRVVESFPKPLACYIFSRNKKTEEYLLNSLCFGGGCINDTVVHLSVSSMPFGGVGESGFGGYHGRASFDTFSHYKSILKKSLLLDLPLRYPPYKESSLRLLKALTNNFI